MLKTSQNVSSSYIFIFEIIIHNQNIHNLMSILHYSVLFLILWTKSGQSFELKIVIFIFKEYGTFSACRQEVGIQFHMGINGERH